MLHLAHVLRAVQSKADNLLVPDSRMAVSALLNPQELASPPSKQAGHVLYLDLPLLDNSSSIQQAESDQENKTYGH